MVKPSGPDQRIGTSVFTGFDIRCGHDELRFGLNPIEKIAEAQVHTIILAVAGEEMQRMSNDGSGKV